MENFVHIIGHKHYGIDHEAFDVPLSLQEFASYVYLDGKLEEINGYDICSFVVGNKPEKEGIYNAKVFVDKCTIVYATLFYWITDDGLARNNYKQYKGLIVMNGDDVSMKYVQKKYDERVSFI